MRLPSPVPFILVALGACAHARQVAVVPVSQSTAGAAEAFGPGVTAASPRGVTFELSDTAYVAVVRVFPNGAQLFSTTRRPLAPGPQRIRLPVEQAGRWVATPSRGRRHTLNGLASEVRFNTEPACQMQHARYEAEHPRIPNDPAGVTAAPPEPWCLPRRPPRVQLDSDDPARERWVAGTQLVLGEHYLVIIASTTVFDHDALAQWLGQVDISAVRAEAAARAMPEYLMGDGGRWGAWVVRID